MSFPPFLFLACLHFTVTSLVSVHIQVLVVASCLVSIKVYCSSVKCTQQHMVRSSAKVRKLWPSDIVGFIFPSAPAAWSLIRKDCNYSQTFHLLNLAQNCHYLFLEVLHSFSEIMCMLHVGLPV